MSIEKLRCDAMVDADIEDPVSKEGIDFCVENCPYPDGCTLFDSKRAPTKDRVVKIAFAKRLFKHGVSKEDITLIMRCDKRTTSRYLAS